MEIFGEHLVMITVGETATIKRVVVVESRKGTQFMVQHEDNTYTPISKADFVKNGERLNSYLSD